MVISWLEMDSSCLEQFVAVSTKFCPSFSATNQLSFVRHLISARRHVLAGWLRAEDNELLARFRPAEASGRGQQIHH